VISMTNAGGATMNWELTENCEFVSASRTAGELTAGAAEEVEITVDAWGLSRGTHTCVLTISDPDAVNDPQTVTVALHIPGTIKVPQDFGTIQEAIDAAIDDEVIEVADGIYTGPGNKNLDFLGKLITVRSENGPAGCIIDCQGSGRGFSLQRQESEKARIEGFTVRNGLVRSNGGAIRCYRSSPAINNCILVDNSSDNDRGGGIYCYDANSTITDCIVAGNSARFGGGIYCTKRHLTVANTIADCIIIGNSTRYGVGGGIYCFAVDTVITNCSVRGNSAEGPGGGIYCRHGSHVVTNCIVSGNSTEGGGGGILCSWVDAVITNCTITGNICDESGGGIYDYHSVTTVNNCALSGNVAVWAGGGVYNRRTNTTLTNCTFGDNSAANGNALGCDSSKQRYPSSLQLTNCTLWDGGNEIWNNDGSTVAISYTDVQAGQAGTYDPCEAVIWAQGNIDADPCFVEPGHWDSNGTPGDVNDDYWVEGDYHLLWDSPCVDAGNNNGLPPDWLDLDGDQNTLERLPFDLDGNPRIWDGDTDGNDVVDMGAYEFFWPPIEVTMRFTPQAFNPGSEGNWLKLHFVLPDGCDINDADLNTPAQCTLMDTGQTIESDYLNAFVNEDGLVEVEAFFDRGDFALCLSQPAERIVTVMGLLAGTGGQDFYGTDTVKIINRTLQQMAAFASHWLQAGCIEPDWCGGLDLDRNGAVNFADFALSDGCCVEVVTE
jgi:predicted outer membrane repeat protein